MKSITVRRGQEYGLPGSIIIYAVNEANEGLFHRLPYEGIYHQARGTMQYRVKSRRGFIQSLRRQGVLYPDDTVIGSYGWGQS